MPYVIAEPCIEDEMPAQWKAYIETNGDYYELSRKAFNEKWGVAP